MSRALVVDVVTEEHSIFYNLFSLSLSLSLYSKFSEIQSGLSVGENALAYFIRVLLLWHDFMRNNTILFRQNTFSERKVAHTFTSMHFRRYLIPNRKVYLLRITKEERKKKRNSPTECGYAVENSLRKSCLSSTDYTSIPENSFIRVAHYSRCVCFSY